MYVSNEFVLYERRDLQSNNLEIQFYGLRYILAIKSSLWIYCISHLTLKLIIGTKFVQILQKSWNATYLFLLGDFNVNYLLDHHQTLQFKLLLQSLFSQT